MIKLNHYDQMMKIATYKMVINIVIVGFKIILKL